jgi:hypothetical protein
LHFLLGWQFYWLVEFIARLHILLGCIFIWLLAGCTFDPFAFYWAFYCLVAFIARLHLVSSSSFGPVVFHWLVAFIGM